MTLVSNCKKKSSMLDFKFKKVYNIKVSENADGVVIDDRAQ